MSSGVLCAAPAPSTVAETEGLPEMVRGEVDCAPEAEAEAAQVACGGVEEIDDCAAVEHEAGIAPDPYLKTAELAAVG